MIDGDEAALEKIHEKSDICLDEAEFLACELFSRLQTQWSVSMSGVLIGLRYESMPAISQAMRIDLTQEILDCLRLLEIVVMRERNSRLKHK